MEASSKVLLGNLPVDHPLRNAPLASIGAETKWLHGKQWKPVERHWKIAMKCFNDLSDAWTGSWEWQVPVTN